MPIPVPDRVFEYQFRAVTHSGREMIIGAAYGTTWLECLKIALESQLRGDFAELHVELAPEGDA